MYRWKIYATNGHDADQTDLKPPGPLMKYGDPSGGTPLPEYLLSSIEGFLQHDMSSIRVHFSSLPDMFGALALTHGTDIYLAPIWCTLSCYSQLFLLGHELAHVLQQWEQRLPTHGLNTVCALDDRHLEAHADLVGCQVANFLLRLQPLTRLQVGFSPRSDRVNWDFLQCYVAIHLPTGNPQELKDPASAYNDILRYADASLHAFIIPNKKEVMEVLARWTATSNYRSIRFALRQPAVHRTFENWSSLARALIGEITSAPKLAKENELAKKTRKSGYINEHLAILILRVSTKVDQEPDSSAKRSLESSWYQGKYYPWYYFLKGGFAQVLKNPKNASFAAKVAVLHDLSDFFPEVATNVPWDKQMATAIVRQNAITGKNVYHKIPLGATNTFRHQDGTLLEDSPIIRLARENGMPLSYGPSYTTGRLMQLTEFSGGSADEFIAMAWGIFAFWNQDYYISQSGIHRFHCVMDMANNYGVPYTPFTYPDEPPDYRIAF